MKRESAVRLTNTVVRDAETKETAYILWDRDLAGFGLRVMPTGYKAFYIQYRIGGGRGSNAIKLQIGVPSRMNVEQARKDARIKLALAAQGTDPAKERKDLRNSSTVAELIDLYEENGCKCRSGRRKEQPFGEKTKRYTMGRLRNHVLPILGRKTLASLTAKDVKLLFEKVCEGATATKPEEGKATRKGGREADTKKPSRVRGGLGAAKHVVRDLSSVFNFAIETGLMAVNPATVAKISTIDNERKDYLTEGQVRALGQALERAEKEHGVNPMALNQIRLFLLTGLRRDEGIRLTWLEVGLEKRRIELEVSKSIPQRPLTPAAVVLLKRLWAEAPKNPQGEPISKWVFPSERSDGPYTGMKRYLPLLKKLSGLNTLFPHLLRHTLGSSAVSAGLSLHLIGAVLGHRSPKSTLIYAHVQDKAALDAATSASALIAAALDQSKPIRLPESSKGGEDTAPLLWSKEFVNPAEISSGEDRAEAAEERRR